MPDLEYPEYWKSLIYIGLSRFFVLKVLYEGPSHGYEILRKITLLTGGCCVPTFGTIYPILKKLTEEGYSNVCAWNDESRRRRKVYTLTPKGEKAYMIAMEAWRCVIPNIHKAIDHEYVTPEK